MGIQIVSLAFHKYFKILWFECSGGMSGYCDGS